KQNGSKTQMQTKVKPKIIYRKRKSGKWEQEAQKIPAIKKTPKQTKKRKILRDEMGK
ncbi:hypothetical protein CCACVL1_29937, partial [Corchorus capsularis]